MSPWPRIYSRDPDWEVLTPSNIGTVLQFTSTLGWARMSDPPALQQAMTQLPQEQRETVQRVLLVLFGASTKDHLTQDLVKAVDYLHGQPFVQSGKAVSVGFCFGGGMSINLACHTSSLAGCAIFYGENPRPVELVERIPCPVFGNYGAEDMRINGHLDELVKAMVSYKKDFEMRIYPSAGHAFFNETLPMYNETAAKQAWESVLRFSKRVLSE